VQIGAGATVGSNVTVIQGLRIGAHAFVGAGAVVIRDVAASTTVVGVPAKPVAS
jgi:acetyltransferase-like isoleucine patch superfamily enzyme